ncbi:MAG TPA: heterodisulfide reductase-related iron-sulfur binding cluster [Candidatus Tumulicola sp.]
MVIEPRASGFSGRDRPPAEVYDKCIRCGFCLPTCPTYVETLVETSGPRGRIALIKSVDEGHIDLLSPGFVNQMHECLDCRACETACPSGVEYGQLIETARTQIRTAQAKQESVLRRWARTLLIRAPFRRLGVMRAIASALRLAQRTGVIAVASSLGLRDAAELAPSMPDTFFEPKQRRFEAGDAVGTAFFHVGCVMQFAFPQVHDASIRMLLRARLSVVVPNDQGCCGAIGVHAGEMEFGRELAKRNIVAFENSGADVYVVDAAGCGAALKEYGTLFADDAKWADRAARFSRRVRDICEVLDASELDSKIGQLDVTVTYQEPCHLVHAQRVSAAPRRLLARIPGLRFIEMNESALCCGSAGIYNLTRPRMSAKLRARKSANIEATGAVMVATANPGCAIQVAAGLREAGYSAGVRHVVELLDDAYAAYGAAITRD